VVRQWIVTPSFAGSNPVVRPCPPLSNNLSFKMFILDGYDGFLTLLIISLLIPILALTFSKLIRPKAGGAIQRTTYESGIEPMGEAWIQFNIRYYMFALLFLLFDVETVFLYPWSVTFSEIGIQSFIEILIFIVILLIGLIYAWRKGALEWS